MKLRIPGTSPSPPLTGLDRRSPIRGFEHRESQGLRKRIRPAVIALGFAALAAGPASPVWAQYSLNWFTIDGGGGHSAGGGLYALKGTIGQPDAGAMAGGSFSLLGGFWFGAGQVVVGVGDPPEEPAAGVPASFRLYAAAPNPLVDHTVIRFDLPQAGRVRVFVGDAAGRHVRSLADDPMPAGRHHVAWDGADQGGRAVATGIYFVRFHAGTMHARQKVVVLR